MIKIMAENHVPEKDVVEFKLENKDTVFMTYPQYTRFLSSEVNDIDTSIILNGIYNQYIVALSEPEYSDSIADIIGFIKLV